MRWTKTTRCIKGGGEVVGAKECEESEVGRCSEMFLDQWRGCTTVTVCKLHHRLHLECSSSMQSPCYVLRPSVDLSVQISTCTCTCSRMAYIVSLHRCPYIRHDRLRDQLLPADVLLSRKNSAFSGINPFRAKLKQK